MISCKISVVISQISAEFGALMIEVLNQFVEDINVMGLRIVLDSPVYYAGQNVTGKLLVDLKKPKKIKGLYIKYLGKGKVQWSEGWGTTMVTRTNAELYLMQYQLVYGSETEESELAEGKHIFQFNYQLPMELPCSFRGLFGWIKYSVRAVIDKPWKEDYVVKQAMTVMSIFDLNHCTIASIPVAEKRSRIFWGQSNPLSMSVSIPVRGFVPGQVIPIKVFLNNESDVLVKSVTANLKANIVFHANLKSSSFKNMLVRAKASLEGGFGCHEITLEVQVPALPPSYLQFCEIIDLRYQLNVKAQVIGLHKSLKIPLEVIIGNIPLVGYEMPVTSHRPLCNALLSPSYDQALHGGFQPPPYTVIFPSSTTYEDLAPPSYEQSIRLGIVGRENPEDEEREFAPLYPVYKFETSKA